MGQLRKNLKKVATNPGSIIYTGEDKNTEVKIECYSYTAENFSKKVYSSYKEIDLKDNDIKWINLFGLSNSHVIEEIGGLYGIEPLVLEDIVNVGQRPKIDFYDDYVFLVLKMLSIKDGEMKINQEQVSFLLLKDTLVVFQEFDGDVFDSVRQRIYDNKGSIRRKGADYLLYSLIDAIVDQYYILLSRVEEKIEEFEDDVINDSNKLQINELYNLRRELLFIKTSVWPIKDIISGMIKEDSSISNITKDYLKDVLDHVVQIMDFTVVYREMISNIFDTHLSNASNKMNKIMTTLTIFSAIFIPLTFFAGIYGMNFIYLPELSFKYGYPIFWVVCISIATGMLLFFKRKDWI